MRTISNWLVAIIATTVVVGDQSANAGFVGGPRALGLVAKRISFSNFTLPPMAFTQFCLRYADQCKSQRIVFRGGPVRLTAERWDDLRAVNKKVNAAIIPERNSGGFGRRKMADRSLERRLQRLCGDQAFRIAGPRLAHSRASSQRSRHLLG